MRGKGVEVRGELGWGVNKNITAPRTGFEFAMICVINQIISLTPYRLDYLGITFVKSLEDLNNIQAG